MKRQGIYTFTPENAVLLRNILVSAPIRKPGRGGYVDSCRVPALFRSTNWKLFYLRSINPMIEKINPTIPIPITSSPIPDEQREIIMAKSSIAIPNPIFFIVNPPLQIPIYLTAHLRGKTHQNTRRRTSCFRQSSCRFPHTLRQTPCGGLSSTRQGCRPPRRRHSLPSHPQTG